MKANIRLNITHTKSFDSNDKSEITHHHDYQQDEYIDFDLESVANGRYKYLHDLGIGGMGRVVLAKDCELNRNVAIKILDLENNKQKDIIVNRFIHETKLSASLMHPGIVPIYDWGKTKKGFHFFTMQYVEGVTLRECFARKNLSTLDNAAQTSHFLAIFLKICDAVAFAHHKHIIHLDIKPPNIMEGTFGEVYLMDWGLAKHITEDKLPVYETKKRKKKKTKKKKQVMGTPGFMAPEQYQTPEQVCESADIFSLGVILFEILTGKQPFQGENGKEIQLAVLHNKRKPIQVVTKEQGLKTNPKELIAICNKCLEHNPKKRYQTAKELADDIRAFQENRSVSAFKENIHARIKRWQRKHGIANVAVAITFIAFIYIIANGLIQFIPNYKITQQLKTEIATQREEYEKAYHNVTWTKKLLLNKKNIPPKEREQLEKQLKRAEKKQYLYIKSLRGKIKTLLTSQRNNYDRELAKEWLNLWFTEIETAMKNNDLQKVKVQYKTLKYERLERPWWQWTLDDTYHLDRIKYWIKEHEIINKQNKEHTNATPQ